MSLNELRSEFELKRLAIEFAEQTNKANCEVDTLYKELKRLQYEIVRVEAIEWAQRQHQLS